MTIQNYTQSSNQELLNTINSFNIYIGRLNAFLKLNHPNLYAELIHRTDFLESNISIAARLYCLEHDIKNHPICQNQNCYNKVGWFRRQNKFRNYCCRDCCNTDPSAKERKIQTCIERYGCTHPMQNKQISKKFKESFYAKHGVYNPSQIPDVQEKIKQTNLEKRGVTCSFQSQQVKDKIKQTMLDKYGISHYSRTDQFKYKCSNTCMNRYGVSSYSKTQEFKTKVSNKWKEKTDEELKQIIDKRIDTNMKTFGVQFPSQSVTVQNKIKQTFITNHGCAYYTQTQEFKDKFKQTCLINLGVSNPTKSVAILNKIKNTMIQRYNVEWFPKSNEYHKKAHKKYTNEKYPDMTFGSSWEFKVYDFLSEHRIEFEYQPSISFEYEYNGKIHTYHPDFKVGDNIYEVKGDNFFRIDESTGQEEMYCPFRYSDWSDERYLDECKKYNAKYHCMINNNIIILRRNDIMNLHEDYFYDMNKFTKVVELSI